MQGNKQKIKSKKKKTYKRKAQPIEEKVEEKHEVARTMRFKIKDHQKVEY